MAHWQQLTEFIVRLPHRAGELARLAAQLRAANVELISCFGPTEGKSADGFHIVPEDPEQFREFASKNGLGTWRSRASRSPVATAAVTSSARST